MSRVREIGIASDGRRDNDISSTGLRPGVVVAHIEVKDSERSLSTKCMTNCYKESDKVV
jgi:hypothetical protein